ncbi:uncharacterized protein C8A04DRAFT_28985 [Dichotomopilus funicola]|uniref:Uncharacterized protein n=1 Tax=Dichotomopilus funicola TaxID=1934379 RepID=A0AAN6V2M7_9PEZI|nr:hypothetical protein C8A04DRAFT_28985 [Dichotomopilus funicola]
MTPDQELQVRDGCVFPRDENAWWWISKILIPEIQDSNDEYLKSNYSPFYGDLDRSGQSVTVPVVGWLPSNQAPEEPSFDEFDGMDIMEVLNMVDALNPSFRATTPLAQEAIQRAESVGFYNNPNQAAVATQAPETRPPTPRLINPSAVGPLPRTQYSSIPSPTAEYQTESPQTSASSPTCIETPGLICPSFPSSPVAPQDDQQQWAQPQMLTLAEGILTRPAATKTVTTETSTHEIRLQNVINRLTHEVEDLEARDTENKVVKESSSKALGHIQDLLNKVLATKGLDEGVYQTLEEVADTLVMVRNGLR